MLSPASRLVAALVASTCSDPIWAQTPDYGDDVRPILAENCLSCHGPDGAARQGDVRLDIPGSTAMAEVADRITATDRDEIMPPPHSGKSLTPAEIDILQRWIAAGSPYERHWSFVAPQRPEFPAGSDPSDHPIDRFVRTRLGARGLNPAARASRTTLVRRLYLDLTGLPPTPAQARAFLDDSSPGAYQRLVDDLLASPHYGERWARRWLDLARYADTNGYEKDRPRSIWPYRDWVVRSLNADLPFDEFVVEQLAGDMLPEATASQIIATGFHRNTMLNEEGGIDPLEYRFHAVVDRVATTGTAFLGLTVGCAQCHTHKFDPITHREYYGLMAYLDNADEPEFVVPDEAAAARERGHHQRASEQLEALWDQWPEDAPARDERFAEWKRELRERVVGWRALIPTATRANAPSLRVVDPAGTVAVRGDTTKHDTYHIELAPSQAPIAAIRLEALPAPDLPAGGPGLTYYEGRKGDFFLSEFRVRVGDRGAPAGIGAATESYARNQFGNRTVSALLATDGDLQTGWSTHGRNGERHVAVFALETPIDPGQRIEIEMHFGRHFASSLGRFRLSATDAKNAHAVALPFDVDGSTEALLRQNPDPLSDAEDRLLRHAFLLETPEVADAAQRIRRLRQRREHHTTLILRERPPGLARTTRRRHRGEFLRPREAVEPHLPEALWSGAAPADRLALARWLASPRNPLIARVTVNRHWEALFGRGIVATTEDFGLQGAAPTHPDLLDWLAVEFVARGWSIKQLHRLIVTSATYQQASEVRPEHLARDPDNLWLARAPRLRLDAEVVRDAALVAAGILSPELYGPPVRPPQPDGVTEVAYGKPKWKPDEGAARHRRSLYTFQKRTAPFAFYATFDAPSGESCVARRQRSDTPLQALTLLNDPMLLELAQALGADLGRHAGEHGREQALRLAFWRTLSRPPTDAELASLERFWISQSRILDAPTAWTALARAVLCLDEATTRS